MIKKFNRVLICIDSLFRIIKNKVISKKSVKGKKILIVFQQVFGDAIIISNALNRYVNLYSSQEGYSLKVVANPSIIKFMKETLPIDPNLVFEEINFKDFVNNFRYYRMIVKKYEDVDTIIVPGTSLSAEIFSCAINARRKVGLVRYTDIKHPLIMAVFAKYAYTEIVRPEKDLMMLQRHRLLLNYLGDLDYKSRLPRMLCIDNKENNKWKYCVVCPGASIMEKCWPIERYVDLIDYIVENKNLDVYLCGGKGEEHFGNIVEKNVKTPTRIYNVIGKTDFKEWVSIIQGSEFVVGNDSATVHIAAASLKKAICIAGVYDKYQFFPYKVDLLEEDEFLPITICKDKECAWCRSIGYYCGYKNEECSKRIKDNKCALCIDDIHLKEVIDEINKL